jgi:hypothetical protein
MSGIAYLIVVNVKADNKNIKLLYLDLKTSLRTNGFKLHNFCSIKSKSFKK